MRQFESKKLVGLDPSNLPKMAYVILMLNDQFSCHFSAVWQNKIGKFEVHCSDFEAYFNKKPGIYMREMCKMTGMNIAFLYMTFLSKEGQKNIKEAKNYLFIGES